MLMRGVIEDRGRSAGTAKGRHEGGGGDGDDGDEGD